MKVCILFDFCSNSFRERKGSDKPSQLSLSAISSTVSSTNACTEYFLYGKMFCGGEFFFSALCYLYSYNIKRFWRGSVFVVPLILLLILFTSSKSNEQKKKSKMVSEVMFSSVLSSRFCPLQINTNRKQRRLTFLPCPSMPHSVSPQLTDILTSWRKSFAGILFILPNVPGSIHQDEPFWKA